MPPSPLALLLTTKQRRLHAICAEHGFTAYQAPSHRTSARDLLDNRYPDAILEGHFLTSKARVDKMIVAEIKQLATAAKLLHDTGEDPRHILAEIQAKRAMLSKFAKDYDNFMSQTFSALLIPPSHCHYFT